MRKWSSTCRIDTLQLLAFLKTKPFEEEPVILYNYFGMHKGSIELLRLIRDKEHQKFVQYFTLEYVPDESLIANVILLIHYVAQGSAESARAMGFASRDNEPVSRTVMSAGDVMRDCLTKNGDGACKELRVFCKNKPVQDDVAYNPGESGRVYSWLTLENVVGAKGVAAPMTGIPIA